MAEDWIEQELASLAEKHCDRTLRVFSPQPGGIVLDDQGRRLLNFSSNDYLGFASHPEILESISDGVFTVDADWRIISFNRFLNSELT